MKNGVNMNRLRFFSFICLVFGIVLFFWWPLSHWLYPDFYHQLLGFLPGSYQDSMVKVIGTCGLLPVFCLIVLSISNKNNWPLVVATSVFSFFLGLTFLYLIVTGKFPKGEYFNVILSFFMFLFMPILYYWSRKI